LQYPLFHTVCSLSLESRPPAESIEDGRTGFHFRASDAEDLAAKVAWAWNHPERMEMMGRAGRSEFAAKYTSANCSGVPGTRLRACEEKKKTKHDDFAD
jgi:glycosyltransferase involved in cell wall biosynthesis